MDFIVKQNGRPIAAFICRTDAEVWALIESEKYPHVVYRVTDESQPLRPDSVISKGSFDQLPICPV